MRLVLLSLIVRCLILSQLKAVNAASESLAVKDDEDEDEADSSLSSWQRQLLGIQQGWQWAMTMGNTATAESIRPAPVTLQIARVGMAQTGTASLDAALTELGYSPLQQSHMAEISDLLHAFFSNHISTNSFVRGLEDKGFDTIYAYHDRYIEWVADRAHEALEGKTGEDRDFRVILSVHDDAKAWAKSWVAMADLFRILITHQPFQFRARAQLFVPVLQGIEEFHRGPIKTPTYCTKTPTGPKKTLNSNIRNTPLPPTPTSKPLVTSTNDLSTNKKSFSCVQKEPIISSQGLSLANEILRNISSSQSTTKEINESQGSMVIQQVRKISFFRNLL